MKRTLHSFSLIINYKTFIITALSVISTYTCYKLDLTAKFPDMLVGVAIVFPVVCYIAWWPAAKSRVRLNLAWLAFIAGLFLTYFVAETKRTRHGNFLWSAQLALFVLFVESAIFCIERARVKKPDATYETIKSRRTLACAMAFAAHVIFGLIYDVHLVSTHGDSSWLTASWWYH